MPSANTPSQGSSLGLPRTAAIAATIVAQISSPLSSKIAKTMSRLSRPAGA